jgi:hypothetical protein
MIKILVINFQQRCGDASVPVAAKDDMIPVE